MTTIREFFSKLGHVFPIIEKEEGSYASYASDLLASSNRQKRFWKIVDL